MEQNVLVFDEEREIVTCRICTRVLKGKSRKQTAKIHLYTHTGYKPFTCPDCNTKFTRKIDTSENNCPRKLFLTEGLTNGRTKQCVEIQKHGPSINW